MSNNNDDLKVMVINSGHIQCSDADKMTDQAKNSNPNEVVPASKMHLIDLEPAIDRFGFWVWAGYAEDATPELFEESGYSVELFNILLDGFKNNYDYVRFDNDVNYNKELPTFNW